MTDPTRVSVARRAIVTVVWMATVAGAILLVAAGRIGDTGLVSAKFTLVFFGLAFDVVAFGTVGAVLALRRPGTQGQTLAVAASTLAAFALFQPVHQRIQRAVDRRFDRARYDAEQTAVAFSARMRDEVDLQALTADLDMTVHAAVAPARLGLWLRQTRR